MNVLSVATGGILIWCLIPIATAAPSAADQEAINKAREVITRDFKDPAGAQFRDEIVFRSYVEKGNPVVGVCGEVNGKNSFGAYAGFKRYYASEHLTDVETGRSPESFQAVYNAVCRNQYPD